MHLFTQKEIDEFYARLGIDSEIERERLVALKDLGTLAERLALLTNTPSPLIDYKHNYGELERTARRD